jgi:hypothetical protein
VGLRDWTCCRTLGIYSRRDVALRWGVVRKAPARTAGEAASVGPESRTFCTAYRQSPDANSLFFDDDDTALTHPNHTTLLALRNEQEPSGKICNGRNYDSVFLCGRCEDFRISHPLHIVANMSRVVEYGSQTLCDLKVTKHC